MKAKTLLTAAAMFLALSAAAFAQATYQVGSIPVTAVVQSGNAEMSGDITFTQVSGVTNNGTLSINYGTSITVPFSGTLAPSIIGLAGDYATAGKAPWINTSVSSNTPGVLVINIPAGVQSSALGVPSSFTVTGVRVQASVFPVGAVNIQANLTSVGNAILAGQTSVTVITSVAAGIASLKVDPSAGATVDGLNGAVTGSPVTLKVKEGFLSAFQLGTGVQVTVNALPPKGVTFSFPGTASTDSGGIFVAGTSAGVQNGTAVTIAYNSTSLQVWYYLATPAANADQLQETLLIPVTISGPPSTLPMTLNSWNVQVSLAPIQPAFTSSGTLTGLVVPRFNDVEVGPVTFVSSTGRTTALLMPYVTFGSGFDTGIAIANTTEDPGATAMGIVSGAVPNGGPIKFYFYPQGSASAITYATTAGSPGSGLDASGNVVSGNTYVVLASALLQAGSGVTPPAPFTGYAIAVCNFTNAHGIFVLSNFTTFGQSALMQAMYDRNTTGFNGPEKIFP